MPYHLPPQLSLGSAAEQAAAVGPRSRDVAPGHRRETLLSVPNAEGGKEHLRGNRKRKKKAMSGDAVIQGEFPICGVAGPNAAAGPLWGGSLPSIARSHTLNRQRLAP